MTGHTYQEDPKGKGEMKAGLGHTGLQTGKLHGAVAGDLGLNVPGAGDKARVHGRQRTVRDTPEGPPEGIYPPTIRIRSQIGSTSTCAMGGKNPP